MIVFDGHRIKDVSSLPPPPRGVSNEPTAAPVIAFTTKTADGFTVEMYKSLCLFGPSLERASPVVVVVLLFSSTRRSVFCQQRHSVLSEQTPFFFSSSSLETETQTK